MRLHRIPGFFLAMAAFGAWACVSGAAAQTATGVRNLPDTYTPGGTITVTIDLTVTGTPTQVGVAEGFPSSAWTLASANPTPALTPPEGPGWYFPGATANGVRITYTVNVPAAATGPQTFDGWVTAISLGGTVPSMITGDTVVYPEGQVTNFAVTAQRDLPTSYQPGVEFDVTLQVTVGPTQADSYVIYEGLPDPSLVEFISATPEPESYDPSLNSLTWSFYGADATNRTITYRVRPKPGATVALPFLGTVVSSLVDNNDETRDIQGDFLIPGEVLPTIIPTIIVTPTPLVTLTPTPTSTSEPTPSPTSLPSDEVAIERDLPETYRVGENVVYTLTIDVIASNVRQLALSEHLPAGWTPVSADPDWATYNEGERLLVWNFGPLTPPADGVVEVTVAPASDSLGPKVFAGAFEYTILEGITPQVRSGVVSGDTIILQNAPEPGPVTITRTLPDAYAPGVNVNVSLAVDVDDAAPPSVLAIQEGTPLGWTMVSANPPYSLYSGATGIATWNLNPGGPVADQTISYILTPPGDAAGPYVFAGTFQYSSGGTPQFGGIEGGALISDTVMPPDPQALINGLLGINALPGGSDFNQDGATDVADLIGVLGAP